MTQHPASGKISVTLTAMLLICGTVICAVLVLEYQKENNFLFIPLTGVALLLLATTVGLSFKIRRIYGKEIGLEVETAYSDLLEATPDAMIMVDENGSIVFVNRQAETLFGYQRTELLMMPVETLLPDQVRPGHISSREHFHGNAVHGSLHANRELTGMRKNGEIFPAEVSLSPLKTDKGTFVITSVRDISNRKNEAAQITSLLRQINNSNDAIFTVDKDLKISSWNMGAHKLYGYAENEVMGKNPNELLQTGLSQGDLIEAVKIIEVQNHWSGDLKRKTKSGEDIWVHSSTTAVRDEYGQLSGFVGVSYNITEQLKLQQQVSHLASLVEHSSEAIISRGLDQRLISWNGGAEKLFGFSKEEAIGKTAKELRFIRFTEDDIRDLESEVVQTGSWRSERFFYHKNGKNFFGSVTANAIKEDDGTVKSLVFVVKDISTRKQLEDQLQHSNAELEEKVLQRSQDIIKSEKRYRYLFENNPMPMWVMDPESFKFLDVNAMAVMRYGYSRSEFLEMTALEIRPDCEKHRFKTSEHSAVTASAQANKGIWKHRKKDGTLIKAEIFAHDILFEGKLARLILSSDVTEKLLAEEKLKNSEKHFRSLIENSYDVISLFDETFKFIYRSPSALRITGWSNEEVDISHRMVKKFIHPDDRQKIDEAMQQCIDNPGKTISAEFRNLHKKGHYVWLEGSITNLLKDDNINGIVFNYKDVTSEKEAKDKLIASEKRFRALVENQDDIVVMMDESLKLIYRSPSAARITGWPDEELINDSPRKNFHPDDVEMMDALTMELNAHPGRPFDCLFRYLHKDGRYIWMEGIIRNLLLDENVGAIVLNFRNVTEKIESQRKLVESEEHFRYTLDHMLEGVQIIGFDWKYIYVNDSMATHGRYSKEDLMGHTVMEKYPGIEQDPIWDTYQVCMIERISIHLENEFVFPNGEIAWFELSFQPVPEGIFILSVDITDRKTAEEALVNSEEHYRMLVNQSVDGIFLSDDKGVFLDVNLAGCKMLGYEPGEIKGMTIADVIDEAEIVRLPEEIARFENGAIATSEWTFKRRDGTQFIGEVIGRNLPNGGLQAILRDVTDRRDAELALSRSEKLYRNLFENMLHGFAYCKGIFEEGVMTDYTHLAVNNEYENQTGLKEVVGKNISQVVPGLLASDPTYTNAVSRVALTGIPEKLEVYISSMDQWFYISLYSTEREFFVELIDNITERKEIEFKIRRINMELEERVTRRTEQLRKSNEELEAFSYSVSHDLRAPLRAIIGFTALLEEDYSSKLDEEAKRITSVIKSNTLKMGNLIDDLLSFSRMGRHEIARTCINSGEMVKDVLKEFDGKINTTSVNWSISSLHNVHADPNMLRQVWINLISNALKYSRNATNPAIEVSSSKKEGEIVFYVKDNGVGFDEKYKGKLFKVFQRLHSSSEFEGTGVGLAIVEKIIDKHGGKVWATASPGEGACFYFSLPD